MRVACLMMEKDEDVLIEPWIRYHGDRFGYNNLFIFDNGSTNNKVMAILQKYVELGVNVIMDASSPIDFHNKGSVIGRKIEELDNGEFDVFIPLDADEFVAVDIDGHTSCHVDDLMNSLQSVADSRQVLGVSWCLANVPGQKTKFLRWKYQKVLFNRNSFKSVDHGFHVGSTKSGQNVLETSLVYIHFHHRPYQALMYHSKLKLIPYVTDWSIEKLLNYKGPGWHLTKYFSLTETEYNSRFDDYPKTDEPEIDRAFTDLGFPGGPFA